MAWTAATSQTLVQAVRDAIIKAEKAMFAYMLVNNPGTLAAANTALDNVETAIAALQA